jgi:hypothetical protein
MSDSGSPISCLPDEILASIFEYLVDDRPDDVDYVRQSVLPLQTVSRLWNVCSPPSRPPL